MPQADKKRAPYKRRLHQPLFNISCKTTTKLGKREYMKQYMHQIRIDEKPKVHL